MAVPHTAAVTVIGSKPSRKYVLYALVIPISCMDFALEAASMAWKLNLALSHKMRIMRFSLNAPWKTMTMLS